MNYVDGFVLPIPTKNLPAYLKMAKQCSKFWLEHGALEYREAFGDDLDAKVGLPFTKTMKTKPGETVVFAWIVFKSRAHRDKVNAKIMKDPRIEQMMKDQEMPFDCRRMAYGGFKIMVEEPKTSARPRPEKSK